MSIKNVKLASFTVFNHIEIEFDRGINVIIGKNGTGKTHLIKAMYAKEIEKSTGKRVGIQDYFHGFIIPHFDTYYPNVEISFEDIEDIDEYIKAQESFDINSFDEEAQHKREYRRRLDETIIVENDEIEIMGYVFIPAKDMLTHSRGFLSWYDERNIPFDKTYRDIISKSLLPNLRRPPIVGLNILPILEKIIGGKVIVQNETFYIIKSDGNLVEFSMEAEGIKKIATLWQLIMNGNINKDTILFWDEPEANINPSLVPDVVEILLELSRQGVQVFLATHDYIFAKYIEVLMKETDDVAFHALYKTEIEGVKCETEKKFSLLTHNAIRDENINLYDAEMKKEFEE